MTEAITLLCVAFTFFCIGFAMSMNYYKEKVDALNSKVNVTERTIKMLTKMLIEKQIETDRQMKPIYFQDLLSRN